MSPHCKALTDHINRLQGQLNKLKEEIVAEAGCEKIAHLGLSAAKSFDSLRAKIVEGYIQSELIGETSLPQKKQQGLDHILKLVKI